MKLGYIGEHLAAKIVAVAPGRKKMKDLMTILGCAKASGSHHVLLKKSKNPLCLKNNNKTALPVHYIHQESAWMNYSLISEEFDDCFVPEVKKSLKKLKLKKAILLMDNAPALPDVKTLKEENTTCKFMPPNTTAIFQPMDQGVSKSIKRRYRKHLLSKLLFEGGDDEEKGAGSVVQFWKALTRKDWFYMINEAWEPVPEHTLKRPWRKLLLYLENVEESNDSGSVTVTELNGLLKQITSCGN
ncbi:Jerky -like [Araneus ventricosus]|uniref:Jerky-like n=1 Tax=Araneus ventricosus TaxID=182803 RepID=A0A4Y2DRP3_ARAVE|nr:Jerky -like [Araneus ventricosus]